MSAAPKTAVIGGTINLGNYENFRFEFQDVCKTPEDYLNLAVFAAGALLGQAAGSDEGTRTQIRGYVARVFGLPDETVPDVRKAAAQEQQKEPPKSAPAPQTPAAPVQKPAEAQKKPEPVKKPAVADDYVCEKCGKGITKTQQDMSRLFTGKALCKACMDQLAGRGGGQA